MRIYLIGFKCSGKTTLGKMLAPALGFGFVDLDDLIEQKYCKTVADLFTTIGESDFRTIEHDTFKEISSNDNLVIATGGGFPRWQDNMELLIKTGLTVYIQEKNQILFERMNRISIQRPILNGMRDETLMDYIISLKSNYENVYNKAVITYNVHNNFYKLQNIYNINKLFQTASSINK
jgi:shikimate kinase